MYTSKDALFRLIKTLSPQEQKSFSQTLRPEQPNNYSYLFETLTAAEEYNEAAVKKSFAKPISNSTYAVIKNQLYDRLLAHLTVEQSSAIKKLHTWLEYAEFLISKKMFTDADIYIERVKKEARRQSLMYLVLEANRWKRMILMYVQPENFEKVSLALKDETTKAANVMILGYGIGEYYSHVMSLMHQNPNLRNKAFNASIRAFKEHEYFQMDAANKDLPFLTACYLAMAKNFIYKFSGQVYEAYEQEKIVWKRIWGDWNFFYANKRQETIASVINYMEALSATGKVQDFRAHMDFAETLLAKEQDHPTYLEGALLVYRLMDTFNIKGENLTQYDLAPIMAYYNEGKTDRYIEMKRMYEAYICRGLFIQGKYDEAIELYTRIIHTYGHKEVRQDYYDNALFAKLLFTFTKQICTSYKKMQIRNFLDTDVHTYVERIRHKPKEDDYRLEYAFIAFFKALKKKPSNDIALGALDELEKKIEDLLTERTPYLVLAQIHFDYLLVTKRWRNSIETN